MTKRGKVLRDTNAGPGLLSIDGQHVQFSLEGVWRSEAPPVPGMAVQVEFAQDGSIVGITTISDSQIAKEQAGAVVEAARQRGKVLASSAIAKFGLPTLIATGLLMIGWFFLTAASGPASATRARKPYFWKDQRASLGGLLPLLFMFMAAIMLRSSLNSSLGGDVSGPLGDMARQMREEAMKAVSLGFGSYLSALACLYFAGVAVKKFSLARGLATQAPAGSKQVAAQEIV